MRANKISVSTTTESRAPVICILDPPSPGGLSCCPFQGGWFFCCFYSFLIVVPFLREFCFWSLFCYAILIVLSSFCNRPAM